MRNYRLSSIVFGCSVLPLLLALGSYPGFGQHKLPRAGRDFTFGIIEGPDNLPNAPASLIIMTVLSPYTGSGAVVSPQGFSQQFTF